MTMPKFVHLNVHSDFSIIDGLANPYKIVKKAVDLNMCCIAITDFANLFGSLKFYKVSHTFGLKPIIGIDLNIKSIFQPNTSYRITLLVCNDQGYKNISILTTLAYKVPRLETINIEIEYSWLKKFSDGLIILSGGMLGELGYNLLREKWVIVDKIINFYKKHFPMSFYLQIERIGRRNEEEYINKVIHLSHKQDIPIVATNAVCFLEQNDFYIHNIRMAINQGVMASQLNIKNIYTENQFLRSESEMIDLFFDIPESILNSVEIAKRCNYFFKLNKSFLPEFDAKNNIHEKKFLIKLAYHGLNKKFKFNESKFNQDINVLKKKYINRLELELKVINNMGFPGYFLIVMEFIQWAKKNNIAVGPGRGSGAGSLVAYVLGITDLDPLKFDLLFERFLNPHRISMPDFDIDFCMEKRDLVINHVEKRYGIDAVAQIITFGTMTAKSVVRDVGRVLGYPYGFINYLSKLIPMDIGITLNYAFSNNDELMELYNTNNDVKRVVDISKRLEGVTRNIGKHAGGVIIAPCKITTFLPLYLDENGKNPLTQFDKYDIESIGLVKFDFLGLKTLTVIQFTISNINKLFKNSNTVINVNTISIEDKKPFSILYNSDTVGIFQLESLGMKQLIKRLKPDCFEDLIALVALFRPGPLQSGMVDNYINRKHGREDIYYPDQRWQHESLKPILKSTYGIILYQEQVMKIAQVLSGYTLSEADILRRAMGKKDPIEMKNQRSIFQIGAQKKGIDKELSIKIFDLLEKFAGYGFNKSHSAAYAMITYQTMWLKYYYPAVFLAAVMTSDNDNIDKLIKLVHECKRMKITILSPCINTGQYYFSVNANKEIIYGMSAIKGMGEFFIRFILKNRKEKGLFVDLFDFCLRVFISKITVKIIEKLILSGCFDCINTNRCYLIRILPSVFSSVKQFLKHQNNQQQDLFGSPLNELKKISMQKQKYNFEWTKKTLLEYEYASLGLYLSDHPMNEYLIELKNYINFVQLSDISKNNINKYIIISGMLNNVKFKLTKKKTKIALLTIFDGSITLDVLIFSDLLENVRFFLKKNAILIIKGKVIFDYFVNRVKILASNITNIEYIRYQYVKNISIYLKNKYLIKIYIDNMKLLFEDRKKGQVPVYIYYDKNQQYAMQKLKLQNTWHIFPDNKFLNTIQSTLGEKNIILNIKKRNDINIFIR
ncbi:DNA polymerase III subunit alpha [Buchnera aphidicola (Thelaxes suberi)]|uniref:DNA polymerase III subunit alpha n=1 Tax=Buchnera aphidicola TaxID=9 RepID=UPI003464485A